MEFSDYRTALFMNLNLSTLVQHLNTNMAGKWTHMPPVSSEDYKWTTKEVSIKQQKNI